LPRIVVVGHGGRPHLAHPFGRGHPVCVRPQTGRGRRNHQPIFWPSSPGVTYRVLAQCAATRHPHVGTPHPRNGHGVGESRRRPWRDTTGHWGRGCNLFATDDTGVHGPGQWLFVDGRSSGGSPF